MAFKVLWASTAIFEKCGAKASYGGQEHYMPVSHLGPFAQMGTKWTWNVMVVLNSFLWLQLCPCFLSIWWISYPVDHRQLLLRDIEITDTGVQLMTIAACLCIAVPDVLPNIVIASSFAKY